MSTFAAPVAPPPPRDHRHAPLRVASVPHDHPYVHAVTHPRRLVVVADPTGRPTGDALLDPARVDRLVADFDALVVHFGYEGHDPRRLGRAVARVQAAGRAVVAVVHDLENPHLHDQSRHRATQDELVGRADGVVTLTAAAADEIARRWGREATVLPHPTLLSRAPSPPSLDRRRRVGVHLKSLRANIRARAALAAVRRLVAADPAVTVDVRVDREVVDPTHPRHDPGVLGAARDLARHDRVALHVAARLTDDEVVAWLASLRVLLLPYGFGTHSGWIELCRDVGCRTVVPRRGAYLDQGGDRAFAHHDRDEAAGDAMAGAVRAALDLPPARPADHDARLAQRRHVRSRLARVVEHAVAGVRHGHGPAVGGEIGV